ncbi:hypothetical protein GQX73_g271 [Xylaria multiplex]|uniref:Uncharacterized protein n=1 Tax=Xylaria multiplex TaxID=323545 RepID=A0A7C8J3P4_9PEZI|nr:hypothetical protein GQX73_g271 [Xylaria multiplex]
MPQQSSTAFSSTSSKTSTKPATSEQRDSSSTYSYDPKQDATQQQKDKDAEIKRLMQTAYKNSVRMGL